MARTRLFAFALTATLAAALASPCQEASPLQKARTAFAQRGDLAQAKTAMELFAQAAKADPASYEARWEGAKACYYYGTFALPGASDSEKMALFQDGIDRAKAAVALRPDAVEGHFWLGVLYGVYGEAKGIFKALSMVPDIQKEMAFCLAHDETVECFGPHRVLGRLYYKLPGFKGGSNAKSLEHLEKGTTGCPTNAMAKLYLAETLEDEGQEARAIALVKEVLAQTPDPRWVPEHKQLRKDAEKLLKKWE